jgi:Ca2+-transporting ATPase
MRSLKEVFSLLPTTAENGLSPDAVEKSRQQCGGNKLTPLPREPLWKKFLEKFDDPIIKILLAAALLSMLVDLFGGNPTVGGVAVVVVALIITGAFVFRFSSWVPTILFVSAFVLFPIGLSLGHPSYEGLAVMVAVILATGGAFYMELKSDREFEVLNAQKKDQVVKLERGGQFLTVGLEELVVGDLVKLEMGDEIPADGRLVKANDLHVDQSLMTGESEPVRKLVRQHDDTTDGPQHPACLYRGTQVVDGAGQFIVTEVGDATYLGQIAKKLGDIDEDEDDDKADTTEKRVHRKLTISKQQTPLQEKLSDLADLISKVGYAAAILIFLALFVLGIAKGEISWEKLWSDPLAVSGHILHYFMYMVIIIVVAVPEGLPMSVTVSLSMAMRKMTRANSLVRQLVACETVGSTTVICSDKTGTLTQNKMQVVQLTLDGQPMERGSPAWVLPSAAESWPRGDRALDWLVLNGAVNSTANLEEKEGKTLTVGNSTEAALLLWLKEAGIKYEALREQFPVLYQIHFSSERKRMTTVIKYGGGLVSLIKGAPEWLLTQATHYLTPDGQVRELTNDLRLTVLDQLKAVAARAMRTLAFAFVRLPEGIRENEAGLEERKAILEQGMIWTGFVAIRDPLREEVKAAIEECRQAGIEVKMITGDNEETARAIGAEIGLLDDEGAIVLTSSKFAQWNENYLRERLPKLRILARAQPLDKFRMVRALQDENEVVAVTGDGTNDAPALKKADVGLAMGQSGTEVAKEASKIVLLDDSFATIVKAIHWGRALYENIQRFIQFQLTINVSALAIAFLAPFFGITPPFTILQLLWINVIMDTLAAIALCSEPPRPGLMRVKPKKRDENIVTKSMLVTILTTAVFFIAVMMTLLVGMRYYNWFENPPEGTSSPSTAFANFTTRQMLIFFCVYVFFQVWNEINCRSLVPNVSGLTGLLKNHTFLLIVGLIVVLQLTIASVPFLSQLFLNQDPAKGGVDPLSLADWGVIVVATASVLLFSELVRLLRVAMKWS